MNKNWYAVMTADVLYNSNINDRQKILMAVIANMSNDRGFCFASNEYLGEILSVEKRTIQRDVKKLESENLVTRLIVLKSNGDVDYRALTPVSRQTPPPVTRSSPPHDRGVTYNNKVNNKEKSTTNVVPKNKGCQFDKSEIANLDDWANIIPNKDGKYSDADFAFYHEAISLWARSKGSKAIYTDWISFTRGWMNREMNANKYKRNPNHRPNVKPSQRIPAL